MRLILDIPNDNFNDEVVSSQCVLAITETTTNGDVIKALFSNGTTAKFATFMRFIDGEHYFNCSEDWWNSPYQKGGAE